MLYLIRPDSAVEWTEVHLDLASKTHNTEVDLSTIDWWKPSDVRADHRIIDAALRHGVAASRGIVVDGWPVAAILRPAELQSTLAASEASHEASREQAEFVDQLLGEGAREARVRMDAGVRESFAHALDEADEEIAEILAVARQDELVEHWRSLGGIVPPDGD